MAAVQTPGAVAWLVHSIWRHPFLAVLGAVALVLLTTRVSTGIRFALAIRRQRSREGTHPVPVIPYWIPWIGHALSFSFSTSDFLRRTADDLGANAAIYCLVMGNSKHNVVVSPSIAKQILVDRTSPISMEPLIFWTMEQFWDDRGTMRALDPSALWGPVHSALAGMMRQSFVDSAIPATVKLLEQRLSSMISGTVEKQSSWERDGNAKILTGVQSNQPWVAEVSLPIMLKNFVGNIATETLMGRKFIENYPNIMNDLWTMDAKINAFMSGTPTWLPTMTAAVRARERIISAVTDHHDALNLRLQGADPGPKWGDMEDVSTVMVERTKAWFACGAPPRAYGSGDGAVFWAMNINANQVVFWMIWYVYSQPTLLQEIREEIAPYVKQGLQTSDASIDLDSLWRKCPLLKGAFFETMRIEAASLSYKLVEKDFIVSESAEDAKLLGKKSPESFYLRKDEYVCVPHVVHQTDARYFRDPDRFDARRFWVHDPKDDDVSVEYKTMKVWGGGKQMCKGKTFAEREVVLFAASIISAWDMEPIEGKWAHPGRTPTAGTVNPKKDVRVRMWKRDGW